MLFKFESIYLLKTYLYTYLYTYVKLLKHAFQKKKEKCVTQNKVVRFLDKSINIRKISIWNIISLYEILEKLIDVNPS